MNAILSYIKENPQKTQRLLRLKYEQLQELLKNAERLHQEKQAEGEAKKIRIIASGGGRQSKLSVEEQIILTLVYLRHLTTFQLLGIQFDVSESTANDTFNYWFPLLQELLPASLLEQVKKNISDEEMVKEILTEYELIVDSEEQLRERPGEYKEQNKYYSGKQKKHTFKNQIVVMPKGEDIVDVMAGEPGPKSDNKLFQQRQTKFDPQQKFQGDKAYQGEKGMRTPKKKPSKRELTVLEKQKNKEMAQDRIFVEHVIRLLKIFRVAAERFRLKPGKYERIIMTICGLVRLRIGALVLP